MGKMVFTVIGAGAELECSLVRKLVMMGLNQKRPTLRSCINSFDRHFPYQLRKDLFPVSPVNDHNLSDRQPCLKWSLVLCPSKVPLIPRVSRWLLVKNLINRDTSPAVQSETLGARLSSISIDQSETTARQISPCLPLPPSISSHCTRFDRHFGRVRPRQKIVP